MVVFEEKWLYSGIVVALEQGGCNLEKWLYSGKRGCIRPKRLYSVKYCCIRVKVVVFGQKLL